MTHFSFDIPTVETDRLRLRATCEDDLDHIAAFMQSERTKFIGGPLDRPQCWRMISSGIGHWALRGYGMWAIEHKGDARTIGSCGFIFREGWDEPELGWNLHDGYEGKSYAYEAAAAARAYGAAHFKLDGVISYLDPANTRSLALTRRLGATFEREGKLLGHDVHIYRHPKVGGAS